MATQAPRKSRWAFLSGRRLLANIPYLFPRDRLEDKRLDLQHGMLNSALGANYLAPLGDPQRELRVLDVACGTGIWCREMAAEFTRAEVVGFDIAIENLTADQVRLRKQGKWPPNFSFLQADARKPFPFPDERHCLIASETLVRSDDCRLLSVCCVQSFNNGQGESLVV